MYVICFYWQGDRWQQDGFKYNDPDYKNRQQPFLDKVGNVPDYLPAKYVNNLYKGVKRFATKDFKFVCFTNQELDVIPEVEIRPFKKVTQMGVLPRLYMFSEEAGLFGHQVLCLDLDILIVGSLADIMGYEGLFCARSKFKFGEGHKLDGDIMSFQAGKETEDLFWTPFIEDVREAERITEGRERYWYRYWANDSADRWDKIAPEQIVSFKRHVRMQRKRLANSMSPILKKEIINEKIRVKNLRRKFNSPVPKNARIVSCHGTPRPNQITGVWVQKYWK